MPAAGIPTVFGSLVSHEGVTTDSVCCCNNFSSSTVRLTSGCLGGLDDSDGAGEDGLELPLLEGMYLGDERPS